MTRIVYDREGLRLSMEGHALAGHYGQDIICAAESMLIMCLEKRLLDMGEDVSLTVKKSPGCISISALPSLALEERCRRALTPSMPDVRFWPGTSRTMSAQGNT